MKLKSGHLELRLNVCILAPSILNIRAGFFALFVFLVSRDCCVAPPHDATGLSAVCDCGISRSYSLTIFFIMPARECKF